MFVPPEDLLDWAAGRLGVTIRDPEVRRRAAIAALEEAGPTPSLETTQAISILLNYRPAEPFEVAQLSNESQARMARELRRSNIIRDLQKLPDLPLPARQAEYDRLFWESVTDIWARRRVLRCEKLLTENRSTIADSVRRLVLSPSAAARLRPPPHVRPARPKVATPSAPVIRQTARPPEPKVPWYRRSVPLIWVLLMLFLRVVPALFNSHPSPPQRQTPSMPVMPQLKDLTPEGRQRPDGKQRRPAPDSGKSQWLPVAQEQELEQLRTQILWEVRGLDPEVRQRIKGLSDEATLRWSLNRMDIHQLRALRKYLRELPSAPVHPTLSPSETPPPPPNATPQPPDEPSPPETP